jgi:hypothetical protein
VGCSALPSTVRNWAVATPGSGAARSTAAALWAAATRRTWKTLLLPRPTRIALFSPLAGEESTATDTGSSMRCRLRLLVSGLAQDGDRASLPGCQLPRRPVAPPPPRASPLLPRPPGGRPRGVPGSRGDPEPGTRSPQRPGSAGPTRRRRQHGPVEPPKIDGTAFKPFWKARTRVDQLAAAGAISAAEWTAAIAYRATVETAFGSLARSRLGDLGTGRAPLRRAASPAPGEHQLAAVARLKRVAAGIPNRRKTGLKPAISCKNDYFTPADAQSCSTVSPFFTDD